MSDTALHTFGDRGLTHFEAPLISTKHFQRSEFNFSLGP